MGKPVGVYLSTSKDEKWELYDWLERNDYRKTKDNWDKLKEIVYKVKDSYGMKSSENLAWKKLDKYYKENPSSFDDLEKAQDAE